MKTIALDFDKTLIDIHTYNNWNSSIEELSKHIRPMFHNLIYIWANKGYNISIVTFSNQTHIIKEVLKLTFPNIKIDVHGGLPDVITDGKCGHIRKLNNENVVLIDDCKSNIEIAKKNFINAIHFDEYTQNPEIYEI